MTNTNNITYLHAHNIDTKDFITWQLPKPDKVTTRSFMRPFSSRLVISYIDDEDTRAALKILSKNLIPFNFSGIHDNMFTIIIHQFKPWYFWLSDKREK